MEVLLQQPGDRGYPTEYLLSRIRGRRSRLISEWKQLVYETALQEYLSSSRYQGFVKERSPESIWRNLVREYRWVYFQMNEQLREVFRPFFLYTELRTLFICLRHLSDRNSAGPAELLEVSLLSDEIKTILSTSPDLSSAVRSLEPLFVSLSDRFAGLAKEFEAGGLRAVEQKLTNTCLGLMTDLQQPTMRSFFARLIDSRNIISLYKSLRLEQRTIPAFLPGGLISENRLREVRSKEDLFGVCSLIREFCGVKIDAPDPTKVEMALYRGITNYLKKEGREPFGIGPILSYLWKCSLEVMNLNVLLQGKDLERDLVAAELVQ